ncbi:MAG: EamA family transporter [Lacisediminihabitans sp.]
MGIVVALALTASLLYGASDFIGALTARLLTVVKASTLIYLAGTTTTAIALLFTAWTYSDQAMWAGSIAGAFATVGMITFYAALAIGPMSLLAPLIALIQTAIPVIIAATTGQSLRPLAWIAIAVALLGTTLISVPAKTAGNTPSIPRITRRGGLLALLAGVTLGLSLVSLDAAPADSGVLPAFLDLGVGLILILPLLAVRRFRTSNSWLHGATATHTADPLQEFGPELGLELGQPGHRTWALSALAGVLLGIGNIFIILALHSGNLAVVAVLMSLYPLATVVLASLVLKERLSIAQLCGVVFAIGAAVMLGVS